MPREVRRIALVFALPVFELSACADDDRLVSGDVVKELPASSGGTSSGGNPSTGGAESGSGGMSSGGVSSGGAASGGTPSSGGNASGGDGSGGADGGDGPDSGDIVPAVTFAAATRTTWEGTGRVQVSFTLSTSVDRDVAVQLAFGGDTDEGDFTTAGDSVTVPAGSTEGAVEVTLLNDDVPEHDETLVLRLLGGGSVHAGTLPTMTLTIQDDDLRGWQGANSIAVADDAQALGTNVSDLAYRREASGAVLWAIRNGPSRLYRLRERANGTFAPDTAEGWGAGKTLFWPGAEKGSPDAEGLTFAEATSSALYACTERDNGAPNDDRFSILRFDPGAAGSELTATHEWNVTADIPVVSRPNLGLEALTWIPDAYLVAAGFHDEGKGRSYAPSDYPDHGEGVFVTGVEATGMLYVYALDTAGGTYHRLAEIPSGFVSALGGSTVVGLAFDRDHSVLWATCDNNCDNGAHVLEIETNPLSPAFGRFEVRRRYARPQSMPATLNNEGVAFAPLAECQAGLRSFFWTDDSNTGGHALRRGTLACDSVF